MGNNIVRRIYYKGDLELKSPLIVGSGNTDHADIEIIRGWDGTPYIPATSFAGVLRSECNSTTAKTLFGDIDTEQSLLIFHDLYPKSNLKISKRDGVRLDFETRLAVDKSKYDYEIIEKGSFDVKIELVVWSNHDGETYIEDVENLLSKLSRGQLRFGAKTSRGFGDARINNVKKLTLDMTKKQDMEKWIDFSWDMVTDPFVPREVALDNNIDKISAEFEVEHSILIRSNPDNINASEDFRHISRGNEHVIPGTSFSGALRHSVYNLLDELQYSNREQIIEEIFGKVIEDKNISYRDRAKPSNIIISESVITGGKGLIYTRNKVDRFSGAVVKGALFTSNAYYKGHFRVDILLKKACHGYLDIILMALKEIGSGIHPVGGETSVGRGVLKMKSIEVNGQPFMDYINKGIFKIPDKGEINA